MPGEKYRETVNKIMQLLPDASGSRTVILL